MIWLDSPEAVASWAAIGAALLLLVLLPLLFRRIRGAKEEITESLAHLLARLDNIDRRFASLRPAEHQSQRQPTGPTVSRHLQTAHVSDRGASPVDASGPLSGDSATANALPEASLSAPAAGEEPKSGPSAVFDEGRAMEIFEKWCTDGPVDLPPAVTATAMSFKISQGKSELRAPTIRFLDKDQIGEFLRFSSKAAPDQGYLFPHPNAAFNPAAHPRVFNLTAEEFRSASALSEAEPLRIRRTGVSEWESE